LENSTYLNKFKARGGEGRSLILADGHYRTEEGDDNSPTLDLQSAGNIQYHEFSSKYPVT